MALAGYKNKQNYHYESDAATGWTVTTDTDSGGSADFGFTTVVASEPVMPNRRFFHPRKIKLYDTASPSRKTERPVGTSSATAWTTSGYTFSITIPGDATAIGYTKKANVGEKIRFGAPAVQAAAPA